MSGPRLGSCGTQCTVRPRSMFMPGSSACRCAARWRCTARATSVCITKSTMLLLSLRSAGSGDAASALVISAQACSAPERVARNAGPRLVLAALLAGSGCCAWLALPAAQAAPRDAPGRLRRGLGLDTPVAQLLGKGLAPAVQVFLSRVQAFAVTPLRAHADVHMRVRLVRVQHHDIAMVRQFGLGEFARRLLRHPGIGARWHRQHDVERLAALADLRDARAAEPPLIGDRTQGLPALAYGTAVILYRQSPAFAM